VPRKRPLKRVAAGRPRPRAPRGPNQMWSYDFVFDRCANSQQLKCLTVTDEFTKEDWLLMSMAASARGA
jgi:putative transposase